MPALISLLDDRGTAMVQRVIDQLAEEVGVFPLHDATLPHLSYQLADTYDLPLLEQVLSQHAAVTAPLTLHTAGIGVFGGAQPIVILQVVRAPALAALHAALWRDATAAATGVSEHYHPDRWLPHITLAHGDIDADHLAEIFRILGRRPFAWEIGIDNLSLMYDSGRGIELRLRFPLGGARGEVE